MPTVNGVFTLVPSYFAEAGTNIRVEQHNPVLEDIASGINQRMMRNGSTAMTGHLPMGGNRITGLGAPTAPNDATRKAYVDGLIAGLNIDTVMRNNANQALAGSLTLLGAAQGITIDQPRAGITIQTGPGTGISVAPDGIDSLIGLVVAGQRRLSVNPSNSTILATWRMVAAGGITLGSFMSAGGNRITDLPAPSGENDAVRRSYVDAAALAAVNADNFSGILPLSKGGVGSGTAAGARTNLGLGPLATRTTINGDDWSGTNLSVANGGTGASGPTAARANLGFNINAGPLNDLNNAVTHGTPAWAAGSATQPGLPTPMQVKASADASAIGQGQSWQSVTGSRAIDTIYTNGTGKPIMVAITGSRTGYDAGLLQTRRGAGAWATVGQIPSDNDWGGCASAIIANGDNYRLTGPCSVRTWSELR